MKAAEKLNEGDYWPVRIDDDGNFELVPPPDPETLLEPVNLEDAIRDSVDLVSSKNITIPAL